MGLFHYVHGKTEKFQNIIIDYGMGLLEKSKGYSKNDAEYKIDKYRLSIFFINMYKLLLLAIIFWAIGIIKYCVVLMISYGVFRKFTMGVHLENTFVCFLADFIVNAIAVFICLWLNNFLLSIESKQTILLLLLYISCSICGLIFTIYAPAATSKSPIGIKRKRKLKKYSFIALTLFLILNSIFILLGNLSLYVLLSIFGLILQTINILPITFKIVEKERRFYQ